MTPPAFPPAGNRTLITGASFGAGIFSLSSRPNMASGTKSVQRQSESSVWNDLQTVTAWTVQTVSDPSRPSPEYYRILLLIP